MTGRSQRGEVPQIPERPEPQRARPSQPWARSRAWPPPVDLDIEQRNGSFVRARIGAGQITACHDLSDGGLLVALTEMALAGSIGVEIEYTPKMPAHAWYFGEDQGRYLCATCTPDDLLAEAKNLKVPAILIGRTGGSTLNLPNGDTICLSGLRSAHERWLPEYMARM